MYCDRKARCQLLLFLENLREKHPQWLAQTPITEMQKVCIEKKTLFEALKENFETYDAQLSELGKISREYCVQSCPHLKHDLQFKEGDQLFSPLKEMLKGEAKYCTEHDCPLIAFFSIYKNVVLHGK